MKVKINFNAVFAPATDGGYIAQIPELSGVNTQGETLAEAKKNLKNAFSLMSKVNHKLAKC